VLLRALCARAWPAPPPAGTGARTIGWQRRGEKGRGHAWGDQAKVGKTKSQAGNAPLLRPNLSSLLFAFACMLPHSRQNLEFCFGGSF